MRRLLIATALACVSFSAAAGQACVEWTPAPTDVRAGLELAQKLRAELDRRHAQIAVVARVGRDLSRYGLRYSHVGFAWRGHPRGAWTMVEELNQCGTATSSLYDDGFGNFFLDQMFAYESKIVVPSPEAQARIAAVLAAGSAGRLHEAHYNLVAYPFSTRYQNSNQWVLETIAAALAERPIGSRAEAQAWLAFAGYRPTTLHLSPFERLGAEMFGANVAFDDQPPERRMSGEIDVVSAESVLDFLQRIDAGASAEVLTLPFARTPREIR